MRKVSTPTTSDIENQVYKRRAGGASNKQIAKDLKISEWKVRTILNPGNQKILLLDIETAPNVGYTWGKYEQTVVEFTQPWYMLSVAVKWLGHSRTTVYTLPDFQETFAKDRTDDSALCEWLHGYLDQADIVVGHNCDSFDVKKIAARMMVHRLEPPSPFKTIDTLKAAKKYFRFDSNKLTDLTKQLSLGQKVETGGFDLWKRCMEGDRAAFKLMGDYNKHDVDLLEKFYLTIRPWMTNHISVTRDSEEKCQKCGSVRIQYRGYVYSRRGRAQRWQCHDCHGWSIGGYEKRYARP